MVTLLIMGKIFHSRYILLMHRINEQRLLKTSKEEGKIWYMPDIRPRTTEEGEVSSSVIISHLLVRAVRYRVFMLPVGYNAGLQVVRD